MQIYKKGQGNRARAAAALAAVAIAVYGIAEAYELWQASLAFYIAALIMILGVAGLGIYLALVNARSSEILIETQAEMKKVAWPPKAEVKGSTAVVLFTVVMLSIFLLVIDRVLIEFMNIIRVYPT